MNKHVVYSERPVQAFLLRLEGESLDEIGAIMGVTRQRAYQLAEQACKRFLKHPNHMQGNIPAHLMGAAKFYMNRAKRRYGVKRETPAYPPSGTNGTPSAAPGHRGKPGVGRV
jgi:hypothetical protein